MRIYILIVILIVQQENIFSQVNPYNKYANSTKSISVLEWKLVQVNLRLSVIGYFVIYNKESKKFEVEKFMDTYTLKTVPATNIRDNLLAGANLTLAVIGNEFPEFRNRETKDIEIRYFIGEEHSRKFAVFNGKNLAFTEDYYNFKKEQE